MVRIADLIQTVSELNPKLVESAKILKTESNCNRSQENVAQAQHNITISQSEEQAYTPPAKPPVLTDAEKNKKLEALRAEKKLLRDNEDEDSYELSELRRLFIEASDDYLQPEPGCDEAASKAALEAANRKRNIAKRQQERKMQRLKHTELDIKVLSK
jgi:hypothetical protein